MRFLDSNQNQVIIGGKKIFNNDHLVKYVTIPVLGIALPNITNLITNGKYSLPMLLLNYALFILLAFTTWEGNVRLMIFLKERLHFDNQKYYKSILTLLLSVVLYTSLLCSAILLGWYFASNEERSSIAPVTDTVLLITVAAIFITNMYENFFLNQEHTDTLSRVEQLNLAKTHAELVALKNQIDPHFIFNSLNTLSYLISSNPANAKLYNDTLAKVYHYILLNREKNMVMLTEEIEFMSNYFFLLKIRFDKAINMVIEIKDTEASELLILPISLQILLENVMKHNELIQDKPLTIQVIISTNYVLVRNEVNRKAYPVNTSKVGLANLDNRYKLLTGKNIIIQNHDDAFTVRLPLININK